MFTPQQPTSRFRRLFRLGGRTQVARDVDDELAFHLSCRIRDLCDTGLNTTEATRQAELEFGDLAASRRELTTLDRRVAARQARVEWWSGWREDLALAWRGLGRRPAFACTVIAVLALGIGAATTVFTLTDAALLEPLPYRQSERLVHLWDARVDAPDQRSEASYPNLRDWRAQSRLLESLDGYNETNLTLTTSADAERVRGVRITPGFLHTLGVTVANGRDFSKEDEQRSADDVVIITHDFWRGHLGGRPDVVGQAITLDGRSHVIIGVLPRGFHFALVQDAAMWLPIEFDAARNERRGMHWLNVVARLRNDASMNAAQVEMAGIMHHLAEQYPEANAGRTVVMQPLRAVLVHDARATLTLMLAAVALVLLIACVNVAGLLLIRSTGRSQELAIRGALGASRWRVGRQLFVENLLLSLLAGVGGALLALLGSRWLVGAIPEAMRLSMPYLNDVHVNGTALGVTALLAMVSAIGAGLLPAWQAGRHDLTLLLRRGSAGLSQSRNPMRTVFIVAEIALTIVLLVGTGLLERSLTTLLKSDFGFDTGHVLAARVSLSGERYQPELRQRQFFESLLTSARDMPGVQVAGAVSNPPFNGGGSNQFHVVGEAEPAPANRPDALMRGVAGDYFAALGIRVEEGRRLLATDDAQHPPVLVINHSLARRLFPGASAIGRQLHFYGFAGPDWTIVGVVADVKTAALDAPSPPTVYRSHLQSSENRMTIVLRSNGDPARVSAALRRVVHELDPGLPLYAIETMADRINRMPEVSSRRFPLRLITMFGVAALLLAAVGIYGLVSQLVALRSREFGIRVALGARRFDIMALVLQQGTRLALAGIMVGTLFAAWFTQWMQSLLYGVSRLDPGTYAAVAVTILLVSAVASLLPARRAVRIDPATTLRASD